MGAAFGEAMSKNTDWFQALERLNAEIDVLIDEEDYDIACDKVHLTPKAKKLWKACFTNPRCTSEENGDETWEKALSPKLLWPIKKIDSYQLELHVSPKTSILKTDSNPLQKSWAVLFWAKRLRAEIQKRNTDCYLRRLDDLVNYLERNLPLEPTNLAEAQEISETFKLYFYFLMELSAASLDYEQIGYAKRARRLLERLPHLRGKNKFKYFFNMAERWIKFANGLAYRHLGQYHKSSLEFKDIILGYEKELEAMPNGEFYFNNNVLELNLLYYPSIINLAIIYLKMQLTYSCLQTLARLEKYDGMSSFKKKQKKIFSIEALRMLERRDDSTKALQSLMEKLVFSAPPVITKDKIHIPVKPADTIREEALVHRFIELAMNEVMEMAKGVGYKLNASENKFKDWVEDKSERKKVDNDCIIKGIRLVNSVYNALDSLWSWVKDNGMDRTGHDRQMAELLAWSGHIISRWEDGKEKKCAIADSNDLIQEINELKNLAGEKAENLFCRINANTNSRSQNNNSTCQHCSDKIILTRFRDEDFESFTKDIVKFLSKAKESWLKNKINFRDSFVKAIDKRDEVKGESVHISRLTLRNDLQLYEPAEKCSWCMNNNRKNKFKKAFKNLMPCQGENNNKSDDNNDQLKGDDYDQIMKAHEDHFQLHLRESTKHAPDVQVIHFLGLQRWNSISPAEGRSLGGGYILYRTDKDGVVDLCVVIDPGFDFIRNLFHCGFSLSDIDVILLSHSHLDHIRDFESIVHLLEKLKRRRVNVVLSLGTYHRLEHIFKNQEFRRYIEPLIIDIEKDIDVKFFEDLGNTQSGTACSFSFVEESEFYDKKDLLWRFKRPDESLGPNSNPLKIWPTRAYHNDFSGISDSFGFIIHVPTGNQDDYLKFGYTGDTKWVTEKFYKIKPSGPDARAGYRPAEIVTQYKDCDVLLIHIGSLINHRDDQKFSDSDDNGTRLTEEKCQEIIRNGNHPYLPGLIGLLNEFISGDKKESLILLSEFGEELRGTIRTDLVDRLIKVYEQDILPVDVGLDVVYRSEKSNIKSKDQFKFWCVQCRQFHSIKKVDYQHFGTDEALFYLCRTCKKTTSPDRLQERLRHVYEVGRTLRTSDRRND